MFTEAELTFVSEVLLLLTSQKNLTLNEISNVIDILREIDQDTEQVNKVI